MRGSRAQFKLALKQCRANEAYLRSSALSAKLNANNYCKFWKDIQSLSPKDNKSAQCVGGAVGGRDIAEMWAGHFSSILNCIDDQESRDKVDEMLSDSQPVEVLERVSPADVKE